MKISLRYKLILLLVLLITVGMLIITYMNIRSQVSARIEGMRREARSVGRVFGLNYAQSLLASEELDEANRISSRLWQNATEDAIFLIAYDVDGEKIFQYPPDDEIDEFSIHPVPPPENRLLLRSDLDNFGRWVRDINLYDVLIPIRYHSNEFGIIRLGFDTSDVVAERNQIIYNNALVTGLFWLLAAFVGIFATEKITRPLQKLVRVANKLGDGDLDARSDINTSDEIEELSEDFNQMADRIQARAKEREESLAQLEAIQNVGSMLNESGDPEIFFPVLDEAMQTLYDVEAFIPMIWDGEVFVAPYSRPELDNPLFLPSHSPPLEVVDQAGEPLELEPEENWPAALQKMNWAYPLKVGKNLNGVLYMKLIRELDEQEQNWMEIWGTQVCQAVRGMVLDNKIDEYQEELVEAVRDMLKKRIRNGYTDYLLADIPDFLDRREEEGLFFGEDFNEVLEEALSALDLELNVTKIRLNQFLVMGQELSPRERKKVQQTIREAISEVEFELNWFEDEPDVGPLQEFLLC